MLERLEFHHMLALSTAHITADANKFLRTSSSPLIVYEKGEYGYFILVPDEEQLKETIKVIPECLRELFLFVKPKDVDWIMLDRDVEVIPDLPAYNW